MPALTIEPRLKRRSNLDFVVAELKRFRPAQRRTAKVDVVLPLQTATAKGESGQVSGPCLNAQNPPGAVFRPEQSKGRSRRRPAVSDRGRERREWAGKRALPLEAVSAQSGSRYRGLFNGRSQMATTSGTSSRASRHCLDAPSPRIVEDEEASALMILEDWRRDPVAI